MPHSITAWGGWAVLPRQWLACGRDTGLPRTCGRRGFFGDVGRSMLSHAREREGAGVEAPALYIHGLAPRFSRLLPRSPRYSQVFP